MELKFYFKTRQESAMENINFHEFSKKERFEIITAFLMKMKQANSIASAESFYEHYLHKFYTVPPKLLNDIVYCQRSIKSHLIAYQTVVRVFDTQGDADPAVKNNYLCELEDALFEINAECQHLLLCLQDDIDSFCLAFVKQRLPPKNETLKRIVSHAVLPLVCATQFTNQPYYVLERPTEEQLLQKYFTVDPEKIISKSTLTHINDKSQESKQTPTASIASVNANPLHLHAALKGVSSRHREANMIEDQTQDKS